MNKKIFSAFTLTALIGAGMATAADVNRPMPPHGHPHAKHRHAADGLPHGFAELKLTENQKQQIKQIIAAQQRPEQIKQPEKRADFEQKIQQQRQREQQLFNAKTFDEQAARAIITERRQAREKAEEAMAERELNMLKTRHAVFQVLTPEQQKQYWEQRSQRREQRKTKP